jgi:hypothetical protein
VEQDGGDEIVKHFTDLRMLLLIVRVALDKFVLTNREVSEDLIVKIHVFFHFYFL